MNIINPYRFANSSEDEFITEWNLSSGSFTFPAGDVGVYSAEIDFGDESGWKSISAYDDANLTHSYSISGTYYIRVRGTFPLFYVAGGAVKDYLIKVMQWGNVGFESLNNAFYGCSNFTGDGDGNLTLPSYITTIGDQAFRDCSSLTGTLTLPSGLTGSIGNYTFRGCSFTGSLVIPDGVTTIGVGSFQYCSSFTGTLTLSSSLSTIGGNSFYNCGFTGTLTLPSGLTGSIGNNAFRGCSFTGSLTIPNGVTTIGNYTFYNCGFTSSLTLSSNLVNIGTYSFYNCGFTGALTLPSTLTAIGYACFQGCSGFTGSLTIPNSVTSIEGSAFRDCSGFTGTLTLSSNITTIPEGCFRGCTGISNIVLNAVTLIGDYAFYGNTGMTGTAYMYMSTAPTLGTSPFNNCDFSALHIPTTNTGYDVSPWTDDPPFSSIVDDL